MAAVLQVAAVTSATASAAEEPTPDLVEEHRVLYEATETDGTIAVDSSTFGNVGELKGQVSRRDGSYRFHPLREKGIYDRIRAAPDPAFNPRSRPFSYGARIKVGPDAVWSHNEMSIMRHGDTDTPGGDYKLEIAKRKEGKVTAFCAMHDGVGGLAYVQGTGALETLDDGAWHQITCKLDEDSVALVIDDHVYEKELTESLGSIRSRDPLLIGAQPFAARPDLKFREQFHGAMDDIHVTVFVPTETEPEEPPA